MSPAEKFIKDLSDPICWKIAEQLDGLQKPNWKTLISKMPKNFYDDKAILRFHLSILRPRGSPTLCLLEDLGRKKKTVGQLVTWLKALGESDANCSELIDFLERGDDALKELSPSIERHPESTGCEAGGVLRLSITANGKEPLKYQWFKGNFELKEQTLSTLSIDNVSLHDAGYYVCRVVNDFDYVYSSWSKVDVIEPPPTMSSLSLSSPQDSPSLSSNINIFNKPLITMHPRSETLHVGDPLVLSADAVGDPAPTLQWYHNERPLVGECSRRLIIESVSFTRHDGFYHFEASNKFTTTKSLKAQITILENKTKQENYSTVTLQGDKEKEKKYSVGEVEFQAPELPKKKTSVLAGEDIAITPTVLRPSASHHRGPENVNNSDVGYSIEHLPSGPSGKVALVIGNQGYDNATELGQLVHPVNDTHDIASKLQSLDFQVVSLVNLKLEDMRKAVKYFCTLLDSGTYAVFYFAGHGFEVDGESYMMPVDASAKYRPTENLSLAEVLGPITERSPKLSVLLVDSCRTQPELCRSDPIAMDRSSRATLQRKNVIIGYGCCARGRVLESPEMSNGYFAHHLLDSMAKDVKVDDVMFLVAKGIHEDRVLDPATGRTQVVYRHSTVVGDLRLTDTVVQDSSMTTEHRVVSKQMQAWQSAHIAPLSPVTALENDHVTVQLIFTPEFSNCLLVQGKVTEKVVCEARNLVFFLPDHIGGARVETVTPQLTAFHHHLHPTLRVEKEKEYERLATADDKVVRISNLERLNGDINIHLEINYETGGFQYKQNAYYCIKEKPLYAKISDLLAS